MVIGDNWRGISVNLPEKFFVKDEHEEVYLVNKEDYGYWMQIDFTHDNYCVWDDTSGSISEKDLIESIKTGKYIVIPEEEGFVNFIDMEL